MSGSLVPAVLLAGAVAIWGAPGPPELRVRSMLAGGDLPPGAGFDRPTWTSAARWPGPADRPAGPDPGHRKWSRVGAAAAALLALLVSGPAAAVLLGGLTLAGWQVFDRRRSAGHRIRERSGAVDACSTLSSELRAGRSVADALAAAAEVAYGPCAHALGAAARASASGGDVAASLQPALPTTVPEILRGLAACWQVCAQAGSGLAAGVEQLADSLRARQEQEQLLAAALAGPQASAALLALLPVAGVALAAGLGAHPVHLLLHTPLGIGCLLLGSALDLLGLWWTGRLVAGASRAVA